MNTLTSDTSVGELASTYPLATRTFARYGIDFCCGGGRPLNEVCAERGLDTDEVLNSIKNDLASSDDAEDRWDTAPLSELIEHLLSAYHRPLDEELPRLEAMAKKVLAVHEAKAPEVLPQLLATFQALKTELEQHMPKEEQILFPMILRGQGAMAGGPISVMGMEHDSAGASLKRLRELTADYTVPSGACTTWRALWHGLEALESSLHQHIHLENNILFPRALAGGH